jgi:hypothetical protein
MELDTSHIIGLEMVRTSITRKILSTDGISGVLPNQRAILSKACMHSRDIIPSSIDRCFSSSSHAGFHRSRFHHLRSFFTARERGYPLPVYFFPFVTFN